MIQYIRERESATSALLRFVAVVADVLVLSPSPASEKRNKRNKAQQEACCAFSPGNS